MTEFSFSPHITERSSCCLWENTKHFSVTIRGSASRRNLHFEQISPVNRFLSRKQMQLLIHNLVQSKQPSMITGQKR